MTLEATALGEVPVRRTTQGYEVNVRVPSYRSLPLSCIEDVSVTIAGKTSARQDLRVMRNGQTLTIEDLGAKVDEEWFVLDSLTILVPIEVSAEIGDEVDLEVKLEMRIPYIILGPQLAMVQKTHIDRKVVVQ